MVSEVIPMPTSKTDPLKLTRLLQLCSANLPVGGFAFSQGLEFAVEKGWVNSAQSTLSWVELNLTESIARTDLAVLKRLYHALQKDDLNAFKYWNEHLVACRESSEFHFADIAIGKALIRLLKQLNNIDCSRYQSLLTIPELSFVSAFAITTSLCELDLISAQSGFYWTYIDNQVAAATKLVPLGQTQAQNLLFDLSEKADQVINLANKLEDHEIGASLPRLAMASAWHETQYTRLFRS